MKRAVLVLVLLTCVPGGAAASFDENVAKDVMVFASAAYCPQSRISPTWDMINDECASRTVGFSTVAAFDAKAQSTKHRWRPLRSRGSMSHAFGFVGVDSDREWVVSAFKGSNETADFITDLEGGNFAFDDCTVNGVDLGKVHDGFCTYYQSLVDLGFTAQLAELASAHPSYKVVITGHSLGAAAAVLAAVDLYNQAGVRAHLITFGLPRVGDHAFAQTVSPATEESFRIAHASDIVTHLPVCCALPVVGDCGTAQACPYHTATEVWYNNDMTTSDYVECDGSGEDPSCANVVSMSVSDHLNYYGIEIGDYCCF